MCIYCILLYFYFNYDKLIKELEVSSNPEVGHYFERAWAAVFGPN